MQSGRLLRQTFESPWMFNWQTFVATFAPLPYPALEDGKWSECEFLER